VLQKLGEPEPQLPPFDPDKIKPFPTKPKSSVCWRSTRPRATRGEGRMAGE